jgi:capsular polysaccharide biosynthesis protein
MELRDYWRVFRRRAWIPVLLAVAAVLSAGVLAYLAKPTYTAAATVVAKGSTSTLSVSTGVGPVVSFPQAATSNSVAIGVIQKLGLHESVDHLLGRIRVSSIGPNLYRVSVKDATPDVAVAVADEVAREATVLYLQLGTQPLNVAVDEGLAKARDDLQLRYQTAATARLKFQLQHPNAAASKDVTIAYQALQLQLEEEQAAISYRGVLEQIVRDRLNHIAATTGFEARLVDQAVARPDSGGHLVEVLSAGVLALVIGAMVVFLLEYLDTTVREPDAAEEVVGAPVIGVIPRANPQSLRAMKGGA